MLVVCSFAVVWRSEVVFWCPAIIRKTIICFTTYSLGIKLLWYTIDNSISGVILIVGFFMVNLQSSVGDLL